MLLEGLFLPLTTPFYPDGRLNLRKLEHNVRLYSKTPAAGLVVLSEHGEPTLLTDEETREVMRVAIEAAAPEKVMVVGVSRDSVAATLSVAEYATSLGYDAVLVGVPWVLRGGGRDRELSTYFQMVADLSSLPLVLSSAVEELGGLLDARMVVMLAQHPNIIGLVDAGGGAERVATIKVGTASVKRDVRVTTVFGAVTGRMLAQQDGTFVSAATLSDGGAALALGASKQVVRTRIKSVSFQILAGDTAGMLEELRAGAMGVAPAFSACAPQACYEVLAAWKDGDEGLADEKQSRLLAVAERIEVRLGVAGIKSGCDLNGYYGGVERPPLLGLSGDERSEIEGLMRGLRS